MTTFSSPSRASQHEFIDPKRQPYHSGSVARTIPSWGLGSRPFLRGPDPLVVGGKGPTFCCLEWGRAIQPNCLVTMGQDYTLPIYIERETGRFGVSKPFEPSPDHSSESHGVQCPTNAGPGNLHCAALKLGAPLGYTKKNMFKLCSIFHLYPKT